MGYCFSLYTPDLVERDSGKFVACEEYILRSAEVTNVPHIAFYEHYFDRKFLSFYNDCYMLNEKMCKEADEVTETTFFTDFLKKHDCSGMIIKIT